MINMTRRVARLAGVTGLLAVIVIGLASPASAAPGDTSSEALRCGGVILCGPFAASQSPPSPDADTFAGANVAGLVTTGVLNTTASTGGATAEVNDLNVILTGLATLTATTVSSQCTVDPVTGLVSGSSSIVGGEIVIIGGTPITLESSPAADTTVVGLTGIATVVLNRQTTADDGTLTVDAIFITLLDGQTVTVASSSCTPSAFPIPMASGTGLALAGGLLGILILGYVIRRRSASVPQAV